MAPELRRPQPVVVRVQVDRYVDLPPRTRPVICPNSGGSVCPGRGGYHRGGGSEGLRPSGAGREARGETRARLAQD